MATGIVHAYTATASSVTRSQLIHPADWTGPHTIEAGTHLNGLAPVGSIIPFAGLIASLPASWKFCNGESLLRAGTYADLYGVIGTMYGAADGTHFNLPDLRDQFVVGASADAGGVPKSTIRGGAEQSATIPVATFTHAGASVAAHTLSHAGFGIAEHTITHGIAIAEHPTMSLTLSIAAQDTVGRSGTKAASLVVSESAHAWTNPTVATRPHTVTQPDHQPGHTVTQPDSHGTITHSVTQSDQHTMNAQAPAFPPSGGSAAISSAEGSGSRSGAVAAGELMATRGTVSRTRKNAVDTAFTLREIPGESTSRRLTTNGCA